MTPHCTLSIVLGASLTATGCLAIRTNDVGPPKTENVHIDRGKAEMVVVEVKMSAGELKIDGGADKLLDATFNYNVPFLKPTVRYDATGFRGHLTVEQTGEHEIRVGDVKNTWELHLNEKTPMDLVLHMGAGESRLNLGTLDLRRVEVHMGVGELKMDLRGEPIRDYDVDIKGGVGEATVYLPKGVGIIAHAKGGIGEISARDLRREGDAWVNERYGKTKVTLRLDVKGGIGQINLVGG